MSEDIMSDVYPSVESIEKNLDETKEVIDKGAMIFPPIKNTSKEKYDDNVKNVDYWRYIDSADYHYFVSRVLMFQWIGLYSLFSAYQCIENYLKGYIKYKKHIPPNSHDLDKLLELCRNIAPRKDVFLHKHYPETIVQKYRTFYELPRYPVYRHGPDGGFAYIIPDDIYILDYFVYQMRSIIPIPEGNWDIFGKGHFNLQQVQKIRPEVYQLLYVNNINFTK